MKKNKFSQSKFIDEIINELKPKTKEEFLKMIEQDRKIDFSHEPNIPKYHI